MVYAIFSSGGPSSSFLLHTIDLAIRFHQVFPNLQSPHNFLWTFLAILILFERGGSLEGFWIDLDGMSKDA